MTPERIKKLRYAGDGRSDDDIVIAADFSARLVDRLTWGELRALLATVGKTCEWVKRTDARGWWQTSCAPNCWRRTVGHYCPSCGGRVVVRDGGTT